MSKMLSIASRRLALNPSLISRAFSATSDVPDLVFEKVSAFPSEPENPAQIAVLRMARPSARNALGRQMLAELADALSSIPSDPSLRAVILTSEVERVFCAGADLKERRTMSQLEASTFVR